MPDFLFELRSEEIPARMQRKAAEDLKKLVTAALVEAGLTYEGIRQYWTPRRLTLDVCSLTPSSSDTYEERRGPRINADKKTVEGFLRSTGLATISEVNIKKDNKKGDFYVALLKKPGRLVEEILADIIPTIICEFPWPKSMRWGATSANSNATYWIRPLQSILCILKFEDGETKTIDINIEGIPSGDVTYGHRFHAPEPIKVKCFSHYIDSLEKGKVLLDTEYRKNVILHDAHQLVFAAGLELVEDRELLEEITGLVEWPQVLMSSFNENYLNLPEEIIRLTIKTHQKCFVTRFREGKLSNYYILVSNIEATDGGTEIIKGNGRVVSARLEDALYFWKRDQDNLPDLISLEESAKKFNLDLHKPLDQRMAKLDT